LKWMNPGGSPRIRRCLWRSLRRHYHHFFGFHEYTQHRVAHQVANGVGGDARPTWRTIVDAGLQLHDQAGHGDCFIAQIELVGGGSVRDLGVRAVGPKQPCPFFDLSLRALRARRLVDL